MPGANCAIFGCGTSRKQKISIFAKGEFYKKWNRDILNIITWDRVVDEKLKKLIHENKLFIWKDTLMMIKFIAIVSLKLSNFYSTSAMIYSYAFVERNFIWVVVKILFIV